MKKYGIVLGYEGILNENMKNYFQRIVEYSRSNSIDSLIIPGNFVQSRKEGTSSKSVIDYLIDLRLPAGIKVWNTNFESDIKNLIYVKKKMRSTKRYDYSAVIFCEDIKKKRIEKKSKELLNFSFKIKGIELDGSVTRKVYQFLAISI